MVADRFEHEAPWVEPERREVRLRISRKDLLLVQHTPAKLPASSAPTECTAFTAERVRTMNARC